MFTNLKGKAKEGAIGLLTFVVNASKTAAGGAYAPVDDAKKIIQSEPTFITINESLKDPTGNVFVSATPAGIAAIDGTPVAAVPVAAAATAAQATEDTPSSFVLESGIGLPASQRGGGLRGEKYPFAKMEVGQSFFVPASASQPHPAKTLASTCASATMRFATPKPGEVRTNRKGRQVPVYAFTKKFVVRAVDGGARVWRTE